MQKVDMYHHYARQAIDAAGEATSKNEKTDLLEIAEAWLQLANSTAASDKPLHLASSKDLH